MSGAEIAEVEVGKEKVAVGGAVVAETRDCDGDAIEEDDGKCVDGDQEDAAVRLGHVLDFNKVEKRDGSGKVDEFM